MSQDGELTEEELRLLAEVDARKATAERLRGRTFEDIEKWLIGEKLRNTPITMQLQAIEINVSAILLAAVSPIAFHQREQAALMLLQGISNNVRDGLQLRTIARATEIVARPAGTPQ